MQTIHPQLVRRSLLIAFALGLCSLGTSAWAGSRVHSGMSTGPAGRSLSTMGQVSTGNGMRTATRSLQGSGGHGATHDSTAGYDASTQTFSHSAGTTTNNGATSSRNGSTTLNGDGTATHTSTMTGPAGKTATQQSTLSYSDGAASRQSTMTGPNGQTVTHQSSTTVTP